MNGSPSIEEVRSELTRLIDEYAPSCAEIVLDSQGDFDEQVNWFRSYVEPCGRYVLLATLRWCLDHHEANGWYPPALSAAMTYLNVPQHVSTRDFERCVREEGLECAIRRRYEKEEFSRSLEQEFEKWPPVDREVVWAWLLVAREWDIVKNFLADDLQGSMEYWGAHRAGP